MKAWQQTTHADPPEALSRVDIPAPELLDLCDRMGVLVQVEAFDCWGKRKAPNDYARHFPEWHEKDLRAMVKRDRNHPSVVMWSTGNEVPEMRFSEDAPVSYPACANGIKCGGLSQ